MNLQCLAFGLLRYDNICFFLSCNDKVSVTDEHVHRCYSADRSGESIPAPQAQQGGKVRDVVRRFARCCGIRLGTTYRPEAR